MTAIILISTLLVAASVVWSFEAAKIRADLRDREARRYNHVPDEVEIEHE